MSYGRAIAASIRTDARRIARDRFLLGIGLYVLSLGVVVRFLVPWLQAELLDRIAFDITPHVPMGVSCFVLVAPALLAGTVGGFLLLEAREEHTMRALLVTPMPLGLHLGLPALMMWLSATAVATLQAAVVGAGTPGWLATVVAGALCAPTGVAIAFLLVSIASNKVEAFATLKITGVIGVVPIVAYFAPMPWQLLAGLVPPYWACKIWWLATAGEPWSAYAVGGAIVSASWIAALWWRLSRLIGR